MPNWLAVLLVILALFAVFARCIYVVTGSKSERLQVTAQQRAHQVAHMEHEELSPEFLAWIKEMGELNHPDTCRYCMGVLRRGKNGQLYELRPRGHSNVPLSLEEVAVEKRFWYPCAVCGQSHTAEEHFNLPKSELKLRGRP